MFPVFVRCVLVIRAMASNVAGALKIYDWKSDECGEAITEIRTVEKRPDPRDWTGEAE